MHGGRRKIGYVNDIAIINLKKPLKLNGKTMTSIKLASKTPKSRGKCKVAGWGAINRQIGILDQYPCQLHEATVKIRSFQECRVNYFLYHARKQSVRDFSELRYAKYLWFYVQDQQNICAGGAQTDSCSVRGFTYICASNYGTFLIQADSGGPLICQDSKSEGYVLSGIVSWGLTCALEKFPGVYSNIAYFKYWIKEQEEMERIII